jgi:hypothetical protein
MFSTNGHTTHQLVIVQAHDPMTMTQRLIVDQDKNKNCMRYIANNCIMRRQAAETLFTRKI